MKQPTLEEVKEYFKNVKEVIPVGDTKKVNITKKIKEDIHEWNGHFWIDLDYSVYKGISILLWDADSYEYAKILTYKEKTFSITESQIKEYSKEREHCLTTQHVLRKLFPEAFESEVKSLPKDYTGWCRYSGLGNEKWIGYFEKGTFKYGISAFGEWFFNDGKKHNFKIDSQRIEATEQEVFEALKNEAVKRGFGDKIFIKRDFGNFFSEQAEINSHESPYEKFRYFMHHGGFENYGVTIFKNGKWAELLETISINNAEKILGKKIIQ